MLGLDYSAGRIRGNAIRAAGYEFVIRYAGTPGRTKNITRGEYQDLTAAGITVYLVYENNTEDAMGGYAGGRAAARRILDDAAAIGYRGGPLFFCADRHLNPGEVPTALRYLDGAASVCGRGRVGAYGFAEFINPARIGKRARYFWQCGRRSDVATGVHLYQRNYMSDTVGGITCDVNDLLTPIEGDDTMSAADVAELKDQLDALKKSLDAVPDRVWRHGLASPGKQYPDGTAKPSAERQIQYLRQDLAMLTGGVEHLVLTLTEALRAELADAGVDIAQDVVERGVRKVLQEGVVSS